MNTKPILKQLLDSCCFLEIAFYVFVLNCGNWKPIYTNKFDGGLNFIWGNSGGGPIYKSEADITQTKWDKIQTSLSLTFTLFVGKHTILWVFHDRFDKGATAIVRHT